MPKAVVIASTHSGAGKTTASLLLVSALKKRGYRVQPFKVGPDYIDPTHYEFERKAVNLDAFMMGEEGVLKSFKHWMSYADFGVVEGVMGLYDGYGMSSFSSTAHVSRILNLPVILVLKPEGMSYSTLALFRGFKNFESVNIVGVIFNSVSPIFYQKLKKVFEEETEVLGFIPKVKDLEMESRHLGLKLGIESNFDWKKASEIAESYLNVDRIIELAEDVEAEEEKLEENEKFTIGVPFDRAFAFYYEDNLRILKKDAKLIFFSPLNNELPYCDAYYFGGGYPELYPEIESFAKKFRKKYEDQPVFGECGGMMFLSRKIETEKGVIKCSSFLDIDIVFTKKLQALGYVKGEIIRENPFFAKSFKGHEFHYSYAIPDDDVRYAFRIDGKGIANGFDGAINGNVLGSYAHLHFYSTKVKLAEFFEKRVN
ncbi:cobyrinic acid a,c-diamide synthase [Ferroglobus placidus DSM 10642]|uniref:Cobyrinic acid a,c-diamide synthase n=1 Tax=Ferroglobus placidus (strain DSM 10642 / AEDII12DO) TaxID=589924 RepID=D3RZV5_FERPA|nr:cobyrinate a,c-diamide synthase [Ferroglobus placidus]ADC66018.1 cobyrinic acid a,c-diamide synthase [Ferroglobus placidus DSM 10642]